jgi:hypothetical protein
LGYSGSARGQNAPKSRLDTVLVSEQSVVCRTSLSSRWKPSIKDCKMLTQCDCSQSIRRCAISKLRLANQYIWCKNNTLCDTYCPSYCGVINTHYAHPWSDSPLPLSVSFPTIPLGNIHTEYLNIDCLPFGILNRCFAFRTAYGMGLLACPSSYYLDSCQRHCFLRYAENSCQSEGSKAADC